MSGASGGPGTPQRNRNNVDSFGTLLIDMESHGEQTFVPSISLVSITITEHRCSHTIVQKSTKHCGMGPWLAMYLGEHGERF